MQKNISSSSGMQFAILNTRCCFLSQILILRSWRNQVEKETFYNDYSPKLNDLYPDSRGHLVS